MGQIKDCTNIGRSNGRKRPSRSQVFGYAASLGLAVTLAACAWSREPVQQTPAPKAQKATFDQKLAWDHLLKQVSFGTRVPGTAPHLECRDWLLTQLKSNCEAAYLQELSHVWSKTKQPVKMWNVVGEQGWKNAKIRVVVLAHWDTRPYANMETDPAKAAQPIIGANDGASGVAVLLELARVMKTERPSDLGIMYLLTDGEDLGPGLDEMFLGARHFASTVAYPRPDYGILLDMIGDKDLRVPVEQNGWDRARSLAVAFYGNARDVGLAKTFPYEMGEVISDDHLPLLQAKIPTIDLIDFDYAPWHTTEDTPDKCSADSLGKVGKAMETFLLKRPAFKPR